MLQDLQINLKGSRMSWLASEDPVQCRRSKPAHTGVESVHALNQRCSECQTRGRLHECIAAMRRLVFVVPWRAAHLNDVAALG